MELQNKSTSLWSNFFRFDMPQIRAFHMSWFAFFLCFFAWFGIAPFAKEIQAELNLTNAEMVWSFIASVSVTIFARLFIGWLCDRIGPRLAYTWLLVIGSIPVMGIAFSTGFWSFLTFRLLIGMIGASFVITQYHTSIMFAPNVVGTANATSAGWGNLGGGVTNIAMPIVQLFFISVIGLSSSGGWRAAMISAGVVCFLTGLAYYFFTQDAPDGNFKDLRALGKLPKPKKSKGQFLAASTDYRVWALFLIYGACFGIELTITGNAAMYFANDFGLSTLWAGLTAGLFGLVNLFARTLGGILGDRFGTNWGLRGRVSWLFMALFCEGLALMLFSQMALLYLAIPSLILFSLFVQMSEGATFSVVPFVNKKSLGAVAGIVGAGGNAGAVAAGFLLKGSLDWSTAFLIMGGMVTGCSLLAFAVRFSPEAEEEAHRELSEAVREQEQEREFQDISMDDPEPMLAG